MKISKVAKSAQTQASTIRYYEKIGLLPRPKRVSGQREYEVDIIEYLESISIAQNLGFTLDEIKKLLGTFRTGKNPSGECRRMADLKIQELVVKAQKMEQILKHGLSCQCSSLNGCYLHESD